MQAEDYTFVTVDSEEAFASDAVVVDVDEGVDLLDAVTIDEGADSADFITLADDTVMLSDADVADMHTQDLEIMDYEVDGADISFMI